MDFRLLYMLFFNILNNCVGSPSGHITEKIQESVLSSIQDLKIKFINRETHMKQELDVIGKKLSDVKQWEECLRETFVTIEDRLNEIKARDEMDAIQLRGSNENMLKDIDDRVSYTENVLRFFLSVEDKLAKESFEKDIYLYNASSVLRKMTFQEKRGQPKNKKDFKIEASPNANGRRAFTLKPPTTPTPSSVTAGSYHIAFTAFLSRDVHNLYPGLIIPFDDVIHNDGQGFDMGTHTFTCPVSGVYLFKSAIYSLSQNALEIDVVKEGMILFRLYAAGRFDDPLTPDQGFNSGIIHCNKGERILARIYRLSDNAVIPASKYSSFSGLLLLSS